MVTPKVNVYGQQLFTVVYIENTPENIEYFKARGYDKRSGSCAYTRPSLAVVMGKKWFWEDVQKPYTKSNQQYC